MEAAGLVVDGWALLLALARVAPAVVVAPTATGLALPRVALGALALAIAAVVAGGIEPAGGLLAAAGWPERLILLAREAAIGAVLGVVAAVPLAAAATAGRWAASLAGEGGAPGAWGTAFALIGALVFFAVGGHLALASALGLSYRALPVGGPGGLGVEHIVGAGAALFAAALALAAPLVVAAVVAALVVGAVERAAGLSGALVPELALRRLVLTLALAAAVLAIGLAVAGDARALPAALGRVLG